MPKNNLLLSIITPSFNRAEYLEKTILSIKNQDYANIEHIIVDGGSTDGSLDILKKYEGTYAMKWISEKDNGCADGMAKGFKMATGDIFCWMDSDDVYLPGALKKVMDVFLRNPDVGVVFGDMFIQNSKDEIIDYTRRTKFDVQALIYLGMILSPQATFWRRDLYQQSGGIDATYLRCADYDFFIRLGLTNARFYHLRDFLAAYRVHENQLTKSLELCRKEQEEISQKYRNPNIKNRALALKRIAVYLKRFWNFTAQGDVWYSTRSLLRNFHILPVPQ